MRRVLVALMTAAILLPLVACPAFSAQKFVQAHRDSDFDMYVDIGSMQHNRGVYSFWVKSMFSDSGRALIRKQLPSKLRKAPIEYSKDFFVYDSNKGQYRMQLCSVWNAEDAEVYREGWKNFRPLKAGTLAGYLASFAVEEFDKR